jgi:hypothetical protein
MQTQGSQQGGVSAGCTGCEHAGSREYAAVLRGARAAKHEPTLTGSSVHRVGGGDNMGSGGGGGGGGGRQTGGGARAGLGALGEAQKI